MRYLIVGAGGTGGPLAAHLRRAGKDVTLIARGPHLEAIRQNGLTVQTPAETFTVTLPACTAQAYEGQPDVVFLCVKGYGVEEVLPLLERVCTPETVVVPILNIFGTGEALQPRLPRCLVTDGCIYIASEIRAPGHIWVAGDIFRVVFGVRQASDFRPALEEIARDLDEAGVTAILSQDIRRDAMIKFAFVSPMAACGLLHDARAQEMQAPGPVREDFIALVAEVAAVAQAMDIKVEEDLTTRGLAILDGLNPGASTSLKRDVDAGRPSELDGLLFQVSRLGRACGVPTPLYDKINARLGFAPE